MKNLTKLAAVMSVAALALAGCGADADASSGLENGDKKDLTIGVFNGWDEGIAASELWKAVLEDKGYDVELEYADPGTVYAGLANGDYDLSLDTWLPITHATYLEQYGADMVDLGTWNEDAKLTIAVNEDAPIDSLEELAANADLFGNRLVGIEPAAGLTEATTNEVIPGYGLESMEYLTSSTPAMLSELKSATANGENIAVTLWRPHWAYDAFPIKDLEDPKGTLGDAEGIHSFASKDFEADFPALAGWIRDFSMDSETLFSLENAMFNSEDGGKDYSAVVKAWMEENQEFVDSLTQD
ncbi:glycine betaine ABC transporter substrate-binding protein [Arthrobacter sp. Sa2BUA2]|uniref:Glycine betaine ABC transporter substrate-binding protein n=1 Tax=Arthrobacter pullicola TaxID=2762224 RepID=A0ABR8YLU7_9MICC|nr:glycine betaine ABC transporter substrate-binding protein [Arthrobacter pullicola]MBD8045023.1 glycine betaine ABC transporter substrate-binding protein [Arthrobacter pullicola]